MNRVTQAYLTACAEPGNPLRTAAERLEFEHYFGKTWGARQLARPLFVPEEHLRRMADDLRLLYDLVFDLPRRMFGGDLGRMCAAVGMGQRATDLVCAAAKQGRTPLYARPDLYYDGTSFTLLELNAGSELGCVDMNSVNEAYLALPEFRAFAAEHGLDHVDTGDHIKRFLRELAEPATDGAREPVVGLIDISANLGVWHDFYQAFVHYMAKRGITVLISHIAEVKTADDGKLTIDGTPIDVAMRYFTVDEICLEPQAEEWLAPVLRAHEAGTTAFYASLDYNLYSYKGMLALVSELRETDGLSAAEADMVDRLVPWTRIVTPRVWEYCRANRERLLLKPMSGSGGSGVTVGWEVCDLEWEAAFDNAASTPYVVQHRADAQLEPVPDGDGTTDWLPVYGVFVFEHGYAGSSIRTLPAAAGNVVNVNTGAAFTSVFSVPGRPDRT